MLSRLTIAVLLASCCGGSALADERIDICSLHLDLSPVAPSKSESGSTSASKAGAAPADVSFGLYPMSVLGIENTLRRNGEAIDDASNRSALTTGPLACVVDSIRAWERAYPADPWIAKDLLTLEVVYLRARESGARELADRAETWLEHDYPQSNYVEPARLALGRQHKSDGAVTSEAVITAASRAVASQPAPLLVSASVARPVVPVVRHVVAPAAQPVVAYVPLPIGLVMAPVPPPIAIVTSIPELKLVVTPWQRFAPLDPEPH
ncbi:MAG: hypothetical protein IAI50_13915 [Candidatus Eremiobacteraeota bacterium]|nr:hypothetical protein [Candidatus Eremiobacteraeota bacterium]